MTKRRTPARPSKKQASEPEEPVEKPESDEPVEPELLAAEPEVLPPEPEVESTLPVPVERDLARADALQRYMAEVARHPLLTREEEHKLAAEFVKTRDPALAYR